jgi:hypothetical protein
MSVQKDPRTGKFYSVPVSQEPGDDTFVRITNEDLYHEVQGINKRLTNIENRISNTSRLVALVLPTATCLAGVVSAVWYVRH